MSRRSARCPGCAAELVFDRPGALLVVCEHCGLASWRTDVALERIGQVAELAPIESTIALRARGRFDGRAFTVVGVVELDHGKGPWHEWAIRFDDGAWAWLAEAQGEYLVTRQVDAELARVPAHSTLAAGAELDLGAFGRVVVAERGSGVVRTFRGELPERIEPGTRRNYADVSGAERGFGTLDYGGGDACEAVYLGKRVELAELALDTSGAEAKRERKVRAAGLACPKCGGSIELKDGAGVERIGCPYCDALLAPDSQGAKVVGVNRSVQATPRLALGARGTIDGAEHEVLAFLVRSVTAEGVRYPWDEYLLRRADGAYRWLVCSNGHWSFVTPANSADVKRSGRDVRYRGELYRHFSGGKARVDLVLGEVYWAVEVGETVRVEDYVRAPFGLSTESTADETVVSHARYVEPEEVARAFAPKTPLARPRGVGMLQPNPHPRLAKRLFAAWIGLAGILLALLVVFAATHARAVVYSNSIPLDANALAAGFVSDEFELPRGPANARLELEADGLPEGRFGCDGALVEVATQRAHGFALAPRETSPNTLADTRGSVEFAWGALPAGRYRVRLEPHGSATDPPRPVSLRVVSQVPHAAWPLVLLLLLFLPPALWFLVAAGFESARWAQSDHA